jgi:hypothetical protein
VSEQLIAVTNLHYVSTICADCATPESVAPRKGLAMGFAVVPLGDFQGAWDSPVTRSRT